MWKCVLFLQLREYMQGTHSSAFSLRRRFYFVTSLIQQRFSWSSQPVGLISVIPNSGVYREKNWLPFINLVWYQLYVEELNKRFVLFHHCPNLFALFAYDGWGSTFFLIEIFYLSQRKMFKDNFICRTFLNLILIF